MPKANTNLVLRNDTILGICEAVGQDFGFHPNWLRLTLAGAFYWAPYAVIGAYFALGAVVALTRWLAPDQVEVVDAQPSEVTQEPASTDAEPVALAA